MRLDQVTDGNSHAGLDLGPDDHHKRPTVVSISNTTQSLPPGTSFDLDIPVGSDQWTIAEIQLIGPHTMSGAGVTWKEGAQIVATRTASEALGHSQRDIQFKKVYHATYSKVAGDAYLTHKIFDSNTTLSAQYIALTDAVLTGTNLRLTFRNYFGGSATLWVKGTANLK